MKLAIHGCYHTQNFGDLLLHDILANRLRTRFGSEPRTIAKWDGSRVSPAQFLRNTIGSCRSHFAVLGGGGYFSTRSGALSGKKMRRYSLPAKVWRIARVPYAIAGVGAGPEINASAGNLVRQICSGSKMIGVRDEASKEVLEGIGVPAQEISVYADLAFTLSPDSIPQKAMERATQLLKPDHRRIFGMHFQHVNDFTSEAAEILHIIQDTIGNSKDVRCVWFFDHTDQAAPKLEELSNNLLPQAEFIPCQDHWTTCALIALMNGVWTSKLHVGIVASVFQKPVYGYSAHGKTKRFFSQIGRQDFHASIGTDTHIFREWMEDFRSTNPVPIDRNRLLEMHNRANACLTDLEFLIENTVSTNPQRHHQDEA